MAARTAKSLLEEARAAKREHRLEDARRLFEESLSESRTSEDRAMRATLYEELAYVERNLRDLETSQRHYCQASEIYRSLGNPLKTAHTVRHAADILREQKKPDLAAPLYAESLENYHRRGHATPRSCECDSWLCIAEGANWGSEGGPEPVAGSQASLRTDRH